MIKEKYTQLTSLSPSELLLSYQIRGIIINKHCSRLKVWSVEMPKAPYSNRCQQTQKNNYMKLSDFTIESLKKKYLEIVDIHIVLHDQILLNFSIKLE